MNFESQSIRHRDHFAFGLLEINPLNLVWLIVRVFMPVVLESYSISSYQWNAKS